MPFKAYSLKFTQGFYSQNEFQISLSVCPYPTFGLTKCISISKYMNFFKWSLSGTDMGDCYTCLGQYIIKGRNAAGYCPSISLKDCIILCNLYIEIPNPCQFFFKKQTWGQFIVFRSYKHRMWVQYLLAYVFCQKSPRNTTFCNIPSV